MDNIIQTIANVFVFVIILQNVSYVIYRLTHNEFFYDFASLVKYIFVFIYMIPSTLISCAIETIRLVFHKITGNPVE